MWYVKSSGASRSSRHPRRPTKEPIGEAVGHARAQWAALTQYCEDGDLTIDNNACERALRKVVTGRETWLFCGTDATSPAEVAAPGMVHPRLPIAASRAHRTLTRGSRRQPRQ